MVSRYHPLLVTLHWLLALLIGGLLVFGLFVLSETPNASPDKIALLMWHMALGMAVFALTVLRLVVRWRTKHPAPADNDIVGHAGRLTHWALYVLVISMAATGLATAVTARLNEIVFAGSGEPLPASFEDFLTWQLHSMLAVAIAILIAIHVGAVAYHARKGDRTLRRMAWIGELR